MYEDRSARILCRLPIGNNKTIDCQQAWKGLEVAWTPFAHSPPAIETPIEFCCQPEEPLKERHASAATSLNPKNKSVIIRDPLWLTPTDRPPDERKWSQIRCAFPLIARLLDSRYAETRQVIDPWERQHVKWRSTTILCVRRGKEVALGGDGQVTLGSTIMKADTRKIRWILDNKVLVGFAGSTADAFALLERFEAKAKNYPGNIIRACTELARDWRTDRVLRRLESLMIVTNDEHTLLVTGQGDVIQPTDGIIGIGSGGSYATAAARALLRNTELPPAEIVRKSLEIAAEIDIYTNREIIVEELPCRK